MTPTEVLHKLLRLGPLSLGDLRRITGWSGKRLHRALTVAAGPRGPLRRMVLAGQPVYRVTHVHERGEQPRGVKPGTPWTPARRRAHDERTAGGMRRLRLGQQRKGAPAGVEPVFAELHGLWRPDGVLHPAHEDVVRAAAQRSHDQGGEGLGCLGARRAGAAGALRAHVERVGGLGQ